MFLVSSSAFLCIFESLETECQSRGLHKKCFEQFGWSACVNTLVTTPLEHLQCFAGSGV